MFKIGDKFLNKATNKHGSIKGIKSYRCYATDNMGNLYETSEMTTEYKLTSLYTERTMWLKDYDITKLILTGRLIKIDNIKPIKELSNTYKFT